MSAHELETNLNDVIAKSIEQALEGARVAVSGGGGHFSIEVVSSAFRGKTRVQSQRLVYSAIKHLMAGDDAPVHAIDRLATLEPADA